MNREAIDLSKIKVGDEVLVRMTVKRAGFGPDYRGLYYVACKDPYDDDANPSRDVVPLLSAIVSHTPKALAVGDRVTMRGWGKATLRLLCIHGPWAWMADDDDTTIQGPLAHLERA